MIRYYLVNPDALSSQEFYVRVLVPSFGLDKGRLVFASATDKKEWYEKVMKSAQHLKSAEQHRFSLFLETFINNALIVFNSTSNRWEDEVKIYEKRVDAIISFDADREKYTHVFPSDKFIAIEEIPPSEFNKVWQVPAPHFFSAEASEFAKILEPIFRRSTGDTLFIIDPYFDIVKDWASFEDILTTAKMNMHLLKRVEIHQTYDAKKDVPYERTWGRQFRNTGILNGISITCCYWRHGINHQRYVLTKHGGVQFDAGIVIRPGEQTSASFVSSRVTKDIIDYYKPKLLQIHANNNQNNTVAGRQPEGTTISDIIKIIFHGNLPERFQNVDSDKLHSIQ